MAKGEDTCTHQTWHRGMWGGRRGPSPDRFQSHMSLCITEVEAIAVKVKREEDSTMTGFLGVVPRSLSAGGHASADRGDNKGRPIRSPGLADEFNTPWFVHVRQ